MDYREGDRVITPDGPGEIMDATGALLIVQLDSGGERFYAEIELEHGAKPIF